MNTLGYYGIFFGLQYQNRLRLVKSFDQGSYDDSKTVVLEVPIAIPYNNDSHFQRVDGTIEYKGEFYHLIKQRFHNDTLQVVLLKDDRHREIQQELVRYSDQNTAAGSLSKPVDFIKDYLPNTTNICPVSEGWNIVLNRKPVILEIIASYHSSESPPPWHC